MQQASTYVNSVEPKEMQKRHESIFCIPNVLGTSPNGLILVETSRTIIGQK